MEPVDSSQVGLDDAHHVLKKSQSEVFHREKGMNQIDQLDIPPSSFEVGINEGRLSVTGASFEKQKGHRSLASVTNANAEDRLRLNASCRKRGGCSKRKR